MKDNRALLQPAQPQQMNNHDLTTKDDHTAKYSFQKTWVKTNCAMQCEAAPNISLERGMTQQAIVVLRGFRKEHAGASHLLHGCTGPWVLLLLLLVAAGKAGCDAQYSAASSRVHGSREQGWDLFHPKVAIPSMSS